MEKAKNKRLKSKVAEISEEVIIKAYRESILMNGKTPATIFKFCKDSGFTEPDFYRHFGSFESLEKKIWSNYISRAKEQMDNDENFLKFSSREKILTFYFMLVEMWKEDRSFILQQMKNVKPSLFPFSFLKDFKVSFESWIGMVLNEGKSTGEIANRPLIDSRYGNVFWLHFMFVLQFWTHDESAAFEQTDAAIEKSVNLAFDLIGKGVLDAALDFGKFMYQHAKTH